MKSVRERERRQSECSSNAGNEGATARVRGDTSSAGDVASESSLPDVQVSANYMANTTFKISLLKFFWK